MSDDQHEYIGNQWGDYGWQVRCLAVVGCVYRGERYKRGSVAPWPPPGVDSPGPGYEIEVLPLHLMPIAKEPLVGNERWQPYGQSRHQNV